MRNINKLVTLGVTAIMTMSLMAGCSSAKPSSQSTQSDATQTSKAAGNSAGSAEKTIVTVWTKDRHDAEFMQKKVDEYNASNKDNIQIKYEIYSDNYVQAVDMVMQSGEAPDMFAYQENIFTNYINSGSYADLTPFLDDEFKKTFNTSMIDGVNVIDGKCYFVPTAATACRLFYNKDIFKRVGIEKAPETLEDMVKDSKLITSKLSAEGIYGFATNMKSPSAAFSRSLNMMAQRELGIQMGFDFAKGEYDFTGYGNIISAWRELLSKDSAFPGCESLDIDPLRTQFAAGKIGMYISFTHAEPGVYANQFPMKQEWGCAQIPVTGGKVIAAQNYTPMSGYLFNAESKNLEAAWKAYKAVFANVDNLAQYYEGGFGISTVPAVIAKAKPAQYYLDNKDLLIANTDVIWPKTPHEKNINAVVVEGQDMYSAFAQMILDDVDIEKGLKDLTDRYNKAYQAGIKEGSGKAIKIENFNPMKPVKQ